MMNALEAKKFRLIGHAQRYVVGPWEMTTEAFIKSIKSHLKHGYRTFRKVVSNPPQNCQLFHANVRLDPDPNDEADDVYVELRMRANGSLDITDAHSHIGPRLPK